MAIVYTEKGYGLHQAIAAAGHWLEQRFDAKGVGTWMSDDDAAVQKIVDAYDPLPLAKTEKCAALTAQREAAIALGFAYNGVMFDSNPLAITRIIGGVTMAMLAQQTAQPFSINWTAADNSVVALDGPGMVALGEALGAHVTGWHLRSQDAKTRARNAAQLTDLDAIAL